MKISVVITTYNKPALLERALAGFAGQDLADFELVVADDGSDPRTKAVIDAFAATARVPLRHVWHDHLGFRKTAILNRALSQAEGDYIVFTDDDCLPRADFVRRHAELSRRGCFLSGGVDYLPAEVSERISANDVRSQRAFDPRWLARQGLALGLTNKVNKSGVTGWLLDHTSTTRPTFNGHNTSAWKSDIVAVNGFDERMGYGGLDRELGERLVNSGIRGIRIRYRVACLHLFHERPYRDEAAIGRNREIRRAVRKERRTWTDFGLDRQGSRTEPIG